jgi:hypothetical protein
VAPVTVSGQRCSVTSKPVNGGSNDENLRMSGVMAMAVWRWQLAVAVGGWVTVAVNGEGGEH